MATLSLLFNSPCLARAISLIWRDNMQIRAINYTLPAARTNIDAGGAMK